MKKIIFAAVGNVVLMIILLIALIQTILSSEINSGRTIFQLHFGIWWVILLVAALIRFLIAKYKNYDLSKSEFSTDDEREQLISHRATVVTYKTTVISLMIALFAFFFLVTVSDNIMLVKIAGIITIASPIIVGFLTYLVSWLVFEWLF
ncbi:hypothetical protein [Xylocopilactobacillus apicola]|uniref:Uncharacterized protein n=1 Tax=Xylocopilactobacillus apicola TaxID=2932184 RepID=A0AAU9DT51_9LACO|nr:hypothetical protein [Xylocopilactobacillus apicola]BDR59284.1 hypothetical protein XA3_17250 [Xylocopilactobacillus apicola]